MTERTQAERKTRRSEREETAASKPKPVDAEKLKADLDSLIDEIDEVLTSEAEETVKSYIQAGGG